MLVTSGGDPSSSFDNPFHKGPSSVIQEVPGVASQIVLDLCTVVEGPAPRPCTTSMQDLVGRLADCSQALRLKLFEDEFPSAIGVVDSVSFLDMHRTFLRLSQLAPAGLDSCELPPTS